MDTMDKASQLSLAIKIAATAHLHQRDKAEKPYILHPLHLMNHFLFDFELAAIAVLHDVIEDSSFKINDLKSFGFSQRVLAALVLLTHHKDDSYEEYIEKICGNFDAIRVKRKDLQHNSDITRLKGLEQKDFDRMEKYHRAFTRLGEAKKNFQRR